MVFRVSLENGEERDLLITQCTTNYGKQQAYRCVITLLVYHVWRERNQRRMQGTVNSVESIAKQCKIVIAWCGDRDQKMGRHIHQ